MICKLQLSTAELSAQALSTGYEVDEGFLARLIQSGVMTNRLSIQS